MGKTNKYQRWKADYQARYKKEKRIYLWKTCLTVLIVVLIYFWYTGQLKFFAQPTSYTTGVVTKTRPWRTGPHAGSGFTFYIQLANYTYSVDGIDYEGSLFSDRAIGRLHEGDSVKVKYSEFFNSISEVIELVKK